MTRLLHDRTATYGSLAVLLLVLGAIGYVRIVATPFGDMWGYDFDHYLAATRRWLEEGSPYLAGDVAGEFVYSPLTFLHPPIALLLFLPFLVLPAPLWWILPLGAVGFVVRSWRPAPWSWPLLAAAVAYPRFQAMVVVGNSDLWVLAAFGLGFRWGWPALAVALKPSLAFLALAGMRHRSFWFALPVALLLAVPFGSLWADWVAVILNSPADPAYSLLSLPWLLAPAAAWLARRPTDPVDGADGDPS